MAPQRRRSTLFRVTADWPFSDFANPSPLGWRHVRSRFSPAPAPRAFALSSKDARGATAFQAKVSARSPHDRGVSDHACGSPTRTVGAKSSRRNAFSDGQRAGRAGRAVGTLRPLSRGRGTRLCGRWRHLLVRGREISHRGHRHPQTHPARCAEEALRGAAATDRLREWLNAGAFSLEGVDSDTDRYDRKLRIVTRGGASVGDALVAEGLARRWEGHRRPWC